MILQSRIENSSWNSNRYSPFSSLMRCASPTNFIIWLKTRFFLRFEAWVVFGCRLLVLEAVSRADIYRKHSMSKLVSSLYSYPMPAPLESVDHVTPQHATDHFGIYTSLLAELSHTMHLSSLITSIRVTLKEERWRVSLMRSWRVASSERMEGSNDYDDPSVKNVSLSASATNSLNAS